MSHPSAGQLEAAAFGWLAEPEAQKIRTHAANCPECGHVLRQDESLHRRLGLLRGGEPRFAVVERVLEQLERPSRRRRLLAPAPLAIVAMVLVAAGLLVASNGHIRRAVRRLGAIIP